MNIRIFILALVFIFTGIRTNAQSVKLAKDTIYTRIEAKNMNEEQYTLYIDSLKKEGKSLLIGADFYGKKIPSMQLSSVTVTPNYKAPNQKQIDRYSKLVRYVQKVYPYSQIIKKTYSELQANLSKIKNEKEKKEFLKKAEKQLRAKFEDELVKMSVTQGRILIKLVDRELGLTTFEVLKELKGSFQAYFWQSIAKVFGSNLKSTYDPKGEDAMIEDIIIRIENGVL